MNLCSRFHPLLMIQGHCSNSLSCIFSFSFSTRPFLSTHRYAVISPMLKTAAATIKPGSHLWFTGICCRSEIKLRALLPSFYLILTTAHSCKYSYYCNIKRSWYWRKKCLSHCPRWQIASRRARITTQINPTARLVHINVALYCPQLESYHLYDFSRPARLKINTQY